MKRNLVYAILGIGVIGVCFSLVMFKGNDKQVLVEKPTVVIEQVIEEDVVDINDKQPDTELDIEVEEVVKEVVENEVISESIGVSEEPSGSIVESETPAESIVETTEPVEEVEATETVEETDPVETPAVVESTPVEAPTQEPVQEQAKPVESTEVQEVVPADVGRSELQQNTLAELDAIFGESNTTQAPPSTNYQTNLGLEWE